jgi:hypothetical protein
MGFAILVQCTKKNLATLVPAAKMFNTWSSDLFHRVETAHCLCMERKLRQESIFLSLHFGSNVFGQVLILLLWPKCLKIAKKYSSDNGCYIYCHQKAAKVIFFNLGMYILHRLSFACMYIYSAFKNRYQKICPNISCRIWVVTRIKYYTCRFRLYSA